MIPKIIWQTYELEFKDLPDYLLYNFNTWKNKNPDWDIRYFSAKDRMLFVKNNYSSDIYELYASLPISIMKKDLWQYLILNKFGGLYVDMDSVCIEAISDNINLDRDFIFSTKDKVMFWMWIILSTPNNKVLDDIINEIVFRYKKNSPKDEHYVANTTGPATFSDTIWNILEVPNNKIDLVKSINNLQKAIDLNMYCYGFSDKNPFEDKIVVNIDGRNIWMQHGYPNWESEAKKI